MNKLFSVLAAGALCTLSATAQTATYQTKHYGVMQTYDEYHVTVGPGTVETRTTLRFSTNASDNVADINAYATVNYLEVDLNNEYVTPKVAFADKNKIQDVKMTVPAMMKENTSYANHYFAGVNGDFFGYITCGVTVANGTYVYAGNYLGSDDAAFEGTHFIIDKDGLPYIADHVEFGGGLGIRNGYSGDQTLLGEATFPDGTKYDQLRSNSGGRWDNYLVLYSPYHGFSKDGVNYRGSTGTNQWGTEAALTPVDNNTTVWGTEGEFKVGTVTKSGTGGNMTVPDGGYVLSGVGQRNFNELAKTGDKVKVTLPFKADGQPNTCRETVGGWPRLVIDGEPINAVPAGTPSDLGGSSRRARTAVGYSADRKKMYIVVVEELKGGTNGLTFKALASFMEAIGCHNAMALDGGGSSVLHVENLGQRSAVQGVMAGFNRPVMNGLFLVTNAPEDRTVTSIEIVDKQLSIKPGRGYVPTIYGYNKYGVLVCKQIVNYTLSATEATFNSANRKMVAPASGEFTLTATYNGLTATLPVKVDANGIDGVEPDTEATFGEETMTPVPERPEGWVDPNQPALFVAGNFNSWKPTEPMIVLPSEEENGVYEFDIEHTAAVAFKMTTLDPRENGGWDAFKAGDNGVGYAYHIDGKLATGKTIDLIDGNGGNIETYWAGKFHFRVNVEKKTIVVTALTPRPATDAPAHIYLLGDIDGHSWDAAYTGAELTAADGTYTLQNFDLTAADGADTASFFFSTTTGTLDAVKAAACFGAWKDAATIEGKADDFYPVANAWSVTPGKYNVKLNLATGRMILEPILDDVFAELEDITPFGYDWDRYEVGPFKARRIPTELAGNWWTAPGPTYSQDYMDENGQVISIHQRGGNSEVNNDELFNDLQNGLSIQDLGGHIGKVLVYNQEFGPGHNVKNWPYSKKYPGTQISFYLDPEKRNQGNTVNDVIRVRLVFQLLHRGRHVQDDKQIPTIYACAANASTCWPVSYNNVGDDATGGQFPIDAKDFYRWQGEGTTIAEIPVNKVLLDGTGTPDPWDSDGTANPYLMNGERFMVYEMDILSAHDGPIGIHFNIAGAQNRYNTYIFKEIKFFNVTNGEELEAWQANKAPRRVAAATEKFTSNTAPGLFLGTRNISYRYYTDEGVKEFDYPKADNSGIDEVVAGSDDNSPAVYYNLQGIRVDNPSTGIYIKRQGSTSTKVLIK